MHTEIFHPYDRRKMPSEAKIRQAERILSKIRDIHRQKKRLSDIESRLIERASNLLDIPVVKLR